MEFNASIKYLKGVGEKRAAMLSKLGIYTLWDLLTFYPRTHEDWSNIFTINDAPMNENVCIRGIVGTRCREHRIRKGMTLYKTEITDGTDLIDVTFFNNKYAAEKLVQGKEYLFFGKITGKGYYRSMNSPEFDEYDGCERLRPIYPQTAGMSSKAIEKLVKTAFSVCDKFTDPLPEEIRNKYCLMNIEQALRNIHFPQTADMLSEARRRLIFEELFLLELGLMRLKSKNRRFTASAMQNDFTEEYISSLPFELTNAQKRAIAEASSDMTKNIPMNRLLQGDVGSGKTAVSAALIYNCIRNGFQSALMAPTEVLAIQHYKTLAKMFENTDINIALLTGSTPASEKKKIKSALKQGDTDLVIGTHAIIQKDVEFNNLALAVTDEQHRFGVNQRGSLTSKGTNPHTLVMSATPIPRTLALIIYGDLDLSILDEMPKGRQKIDTFLINGEIRERAYGYVKKHLCEGRQGYIVCALVAENEASELTAATELYKNLADGFFKGFRVGLLHGKMKPAEKKSVMDSFASGETQLLVSTTVIEVGIDVPNAVIMVIENAERFGLSQLHQLRGRIGRGTEKSTCIMISDAQNETTEHRLKVLASTSDGFKIADEDLKLRGPGDFFGSRQHGLPELKIADMMTDGEAIRETHLAASQLLQKNPALAGEEYVSLRNAVNRLFSGGISMN
ncbi:MAG: ATP-dependent DNA helicase RecG [Acutalibacteraceae bacterium]|nr:ATP-dependent DNA helicase RecG [Acutalibacteraceae bacterium]